MSSQKISKRSIIGIIVGIILLLGAAAGFWAYRLLYAPDFDIHKTAYIYVDDRKDFDEVYKQLVDSARMKRGSDFKMLAEQLKYPENMKTGRYAVEPDMNHLELIRQLRSGQQTATRITFNNIRFIDDLAERLDGQLMFSKEELLTYLKDPEYLQTIGFTPETVSAMFIPNTYEVYWNISPERFIQRMKKEYDTFWTDARKQKAQQIGLTPVEVAILASIVEEETAVPDEFPVVAGLYINRLHKGMLLQADPTLKFAAGDFSLKRVLNIHKTIDSPYNTYMYTGLPPGPLRMPSVRSMEAVLNYTNHKYIYMCAKEDFSGRHNFAITLAEHTRNAQRYQAELNRRGIR